MSKDCKYSSEILRVSRDGGQTWEDVQPLTYRKKNLETALSKECGYSNASKYSGDDFTIIAIQDRINLSFSSSHAKSMKYSLDSGSTWHDADFSGGTPAAYYHSFPELRRGQDIRIKVTSFDIPHRVSSAGQLHSTGLYEIRGKLSSLTHTDYQPWYMFEDETNLISAEDLYMVVNSQFSEFWGTFSGCTNLIKAPTIFYSTYDGTWGGAQDMFRGCTSLQNAPVLMPKYGNYSNMFYGCRNINEIYCFAESGTTTDWVVGVSSSGTFHKLNTRNDWTRGGSGIPTNWNVTNLPVTNNS